MASVDMAARRAALAKSQLFGALEPAELDAVLAQAAVRRMARNAVILRQGDASTGALIVVAGRVRGLATPDALGHAASAIHGVLERTAQRGPEEMRIVESADVMLDPKPRFAAVAIRPSEHPGHFS